MTRPTPMPEPTVAAFDFDGTLTRRSTFLSFLYFASSSTMAFTAHLGGLLPYVPLPVFAGESGRHVFKEQVISQFFTGMSKEALHSYAKAFLDDQVDLFFPQGLKRLEWHLAEGHQCYLVSANLAPFLSVWTARYPKLQLLATEMECKEEIYTGRLQGRNCWGEEKKRRLLAALEPIKNLTLYAYGDSAGDAALLKYADYPHYRPFRSS